ncbi:MAG: class IV adenylate cyclase [Gemmatimonadaceae bacterium]
MRETELKGVVQDETAARSALEGAGARRVFRGSLIDRRYDTPDFRLRMRDEVLRVRITCDGGSANARVDFKGPASYPNGFKVREELGSDVADAAAVERILAALGLQVTREIERDIDVFEVQGAIIRFERYPRMDLLLEVEGEPEAIERAIAILGLPRGQFTAERLADFVTRYERRTGQRAALCTRELQGDFRFRLDDA